MQAAQAMKNVKQLLEEAGSDLSHIVKNHHLYHRSALPRAGLSGSRQMAEGRFPDLDRAGGFSAGAAAVADGDRRDCGDPG